MKNKPNKTEFLIPIKNPSIIDAIVKNIDYAIDLANKTK